MAALGTLSEVGVPAFHAVVRAYKAHERASLMGAPVGAHAGPGTAAGGGSGGGGSGGGDGGFGGGSGGGFIGAGVDGRTSWILSILGLAAYDSRDLTFRINGSQAVPFDAGTYSSAGPDRTSATLSIYDSQSADQGFQAERTASTVGPVRIHFKDVGKQDNHCESAPHGDFSGTLLPLSGNDAGHTNFFGNF